MEWNVKVDVHASNKLDAEVNVQCVPFCCLSNIKQNWTTTLGRRDHLMERETEQRK